MGNPLLTRITFYLGLALVFVAGIVKLLQMFRVTVPGNTTARGMILYGMAMLAVAIANVICGRETAEAQKTKSASA